MLPERSSNPLAVHVWADEQVIEVRAITKADDSTEAASVLCDVVPEVG
jgi:hypothetical protein